MGAWHIKVQYSLSISHHYSDITTRESPITYTHISWHITLEMLTLVSILDEKNIETLNFISDCLNQNIVWSPKSVTQGTLIKFINSLRPRDAYMRHQSRPSLVQIMACRLCGTKPLSEPMLDYCKLDPWEHISVKFWSKYNNFHWRKCIWRCRLEDGGHLVSASMCQLTCRYKPGWFC